MRCPKCNARADVQETRLRKCKPGRYRRYRCFNNHTFATEELVLKLIDDKDDRKTT